MRPLNIFRKGHFGYEYRFIVLRFPEIQSHAAASMEITNGDTLMQNRLNMAMRTFLRYSRSSFCWTIPLIQSSRLNTNRIGQSQQVYIRNTRKTVKTVSMNTRAQFFSPSAQAEYRATLSAQSAWLAPWASMYTFTLGSVPEGRTMTEVPSASS